MKKFTHLDLFSGIGGFALALDPEAPIFGDINKFVEGLTGVPVVEYAYPDGIPTEDKIRQRPEYVREGDVDTRSGGLFSDYETGDVEGTEKTRDEVQERRETK